MTPQESSESAICKGKPVSWGSGLCHLYVSWIEKQLLTGAKRREWMRMGVAGMIINSDYVSFPKIPC